MLVTNVWPDSLPLPLVEHQGAARNTTLVGQLENGNILRRQRSSKTYANVPVRWGLNVAQFDAFQEYVNVTLDNAAAQFAIELRYPRSSVLTSYAARFGTEWQASYTEGVWIITAQLELVGTLQIADSVYNPLAGFDSFLTSDGDSLVTSDGDTYYVTEP